jgi:hypothetical protein
MIRTLIIISVVGTILSVVCLSASAAIGGRDLATKGWSWSEWAVRVDEENDDVFIGPAPQGRGGVYINGKKVEEDIGDYSSMHEGPTETREFVWAGDSEINLGFPADLVYTQGPTPKVVVTGPTGALNRFYVDEDDFRLRGWRSSNTFTGIPTDANVNSRRPPRLKIEVTAPGVTRFDLSGTENLEIRNYAQDSLTLDLSGAAKARVEGAARLLVLDLDGAASLEAGTFRAEQLSADLSDAARATVSARATADIDASGASHLIFTTRPAQVNQDLSGASTVEMASPAPAPQAAASKGASK